jgi:hypothetical protein
MPSDNATALALILEANISGRSSAGTGPAPRAKDSTYLYKLYSQYFKLKAQINKNPSAQGHIR